MDSVSKQKYVHPLLFCPWLSLRNVEEEYRFAQFGESPIISPSFSGESSSSYHSRPLELCNIIEGTYGKCQVCAIDSLPGTTYYSCSQCLYKISSPPDAMGYHKECIEPISKHPYHPKHSLRLQSNWRSPKFPSRLCLCCSYFSDWMYNCSLCNFFMCPSCARKPPILTIYHPKRHEHNLFYFLRNESLTCDVCALSHHKSLIYSCPQCVFIVHKECVYLPCIIRISRHEHRLSFNSSLTPEKWSCGVCRRNIDTNYGRYTCVKGCSYGVHPKCATREDVWDGKELEETPEDANEDVKSFKEISDGVIEHFSHENHHMILDKDINRESGENKRCQGCALPIYDDIIYNCMQCDFILHQECAHLPRKKQHALHPHPITLEVDPREWCSACSRKSNGFMYECRAAGCVFKLDVCCSYVSEPFDYQCHPHSLFLTSQFEQTCSVCQRSRQICLNCGECEFLLCFRCATLPNKLRYNPDEHFLILSYNKDASGQYWCDVCEKEAYLNTNGIYMCNDCNVILHIQCLLGEEEIYMIPGGRMVDCYRFVNILPNNHLTRNICWYCHNRCKKKIVYKTPEELILCSYQCLQKSAVTPRI